jgi:hypothetical protein
MKSLKELTKMIIIKNGLGGREDLPIDLHSDGFNQIKSIWTIDAGEQSPPHCTEIKLYNFFNSHPRGE